MGTIAFNCLGVNGLASGSDPAAVVMTLSSATLGILIAARLAGFDIVFHLTSIRASEADDAPHATTINKRHVVQNPCVWSEGNHSRLTVILSAIYPHQRILPIEFTSQGERHTVLGEVSLVLTLVEVDLHDLM